VSTPIDLTITVVSWNTRELLRACLLSIPTGAPRVSVEIHVVDNHSHDGSMEMVRDEFPHVRLFANTENLGFACANNQSWREAKGHYWLLLNSDAEARPGALDTLVQFMDERPAAGLATARLVSPDGSPQHCAQPPVSLWRPLLEASRLHKLLPRRIRSRWLLGPYFDYAESVAVGWTWGTALIARREAVEAAGPLSEKFFMYGEDLEWCLRVSRRGWEVWFCADAEVLHHGGQSSIQQWDNAAKRQVTLDGIYRAVGMHRPRAYVALLHAANLNSFRLQAIADRLRGKAPDSARAMIAYHRDALRRALWT
jgi:GT2 family glycosyltransferase